MTKTKSNSQSKYAVALIVIPILLVLVSFVSLIAINLIFNPIFWMTPDTEPVASTPYVITILNGVSLIIGAIGLLSAIPGVAAGIYLLVNKKRVNAKNTSR